MKHHFKQIYLSLILSFFSINLLISQPSIIQSNNEFAFSLFNNISNQEDNNLLISPISLSMGLTMAYEGAKDNTNLQMQQVLKFHQKQDVIHSEYKKLISDYDNNKFMNISNFVIKQEKYPFKEKYFQTLKDFKAEIESGNFIDDQNRENIRLNVNKKVSEKTNNKIYNLLGKNDIDQLTRLLLVNTIYFNAEWETQFDVKQTKKQPFYGLNERIFLSEFMSVTNSFQYFENEKIQLVEIPYKNSDFSFIAIQTKKIDDFQNFCNEIKFNDLDKYLKETSKKKLNLGLPKFEISNQYKLKSTLIELGMADAFSEAKANFKNISSKKYLLIDDVIHQTYINVNESGTEASAATAVIIREKSMPQNIIFNKPFIFVIKDNKNGNIIFIGKFQVAEIQEY
ncbi:MAG: serpin family protein [Bacteroidales bacterium]|jgi:serpin B|nr:serpin family protein [Bacteroidales bacterium]